MATATSSETDIYECPVCLHYMLDRNPRSLRCLHTFCEECLIKLIKNEQIQCATCRHVTPTPNNDVTQLPINFILSQVKMGQAGLKSDTKENRDCYVCELHPGSFLCKECESAICSICKAKHEKMEKYQEHEIVKLMPHYICRKHALFSSMMCMKCACALCVKCTFLDHEEHSEYFEDYWKGANLLRKELESIYGELLGEKQSLDESHLNLKSKVHQIAQIKKGFQQQKVSLTAKCTKTEERITVIETEYEDHHELMKSHDESRQLCIEALQLVNLAVVNSEEYNICEKFPAFKEAAKKAIQATSSSCNLKYNLPPFLPEPCLNKHYPVVQPLKEGRHLIKIQHLLDVKRTETHSYCHQIGFIGEHLACVASEKPYHVACLDKNGKLIQKYYPEKDSDISGFGVWKNSLFIVQMEGLTILPLWHDGEKKFYQRNIDFRSQVLPLSDFELVISVWRMDGFLYSWNLEKGQARTVVSNLKNPFYITMAKTKSGPIFVLTEWGMNRINIYNSKWELLNQFGGKGAKNGLFDRPHAIAITEFGTLLISDATNSRVCHFTLDGKFINNILTANDGVEEPHGIAYKHPYLWVGPHMNSSMSLRCYKVAWL